LECIMRFVKPAMARASAGNAKPLGGFARKESK